MAKRTTTQPQELKNLLAKITEQSYLVKDIAQVLDYGLAEEITKTVSSYPYCALDYLVSIPKDKHKDYAAAISSRDIHPYYHWIDDNDVIKIKDIDTQHYVQLQVEKLLFRVNSYRMEAWYDNRKKIVFYDTIALQCKPELNIDYYFAMYWFNSPFAHFLLYAQRKNTKQLTVEDLGNLPFPPLSATQYKELAPQLSTLAEYQWCFYCEIAMFWDEFTEYFYHTKYIGTPVEYNFHQYSWEEFMKIILAIRRKMKVSLGVSQKEVKKLLYKEFQYRKHTASALAYKIKDLEKEVARYLYQLYKLTAEEIAWIENEK
ncbi:MAG: hypothetical protein ACOVQA_12175 [Thermoflexibacteraceae bacterium]